jgi:pyrroloquinoline quinone (PQQ) biosynthesis protein C
MNSSIDYLYEGESGEFIHALELEIGIHPALNHPFLTRLGDGDFGNTAAVLRDYAHQYSVYSEWFTRYLDGVIKNLESEAHVNALMKNLEEEKGIPDSPNPEELPHVELFQRFKDQIGGIRGVGLAAIGLGTEFIISSIYPSIINAIENHTDLGSDASFFFRLHLDCDDNHAEVVKTLTMEVAEDVSTREAIRFGVFSSLNLRKAFWDTQLARADYLV